VGTELYFQKPNGDLFEMGKTRTGWWVDFMMDYHHTEPKPLPNIDDLSTVLSVCAREHGSWEDSIDLDAYCVEVAHRLHDWASGDPVVSLTDAADDCDFRRITGTRYDRELA